MLFRSGLFEVHEDFQMCITILTRGPSMMYQPFEKRYFFRIIQNERIEGVMFVYAGSQSFADRKAREITTWEGVKLQAVECPTTAKRGEWDD